MVFPGGLVNMHTHFVAISTSARWRMQMTLCMATRGWHEKVAN